MKKVFKFIGELISTKSDTSSKRFIAIWAMCLVTIIIVLAIWKKDLSDNVLSALYALLAFVAAALGITSYQAIKQSSNHNQE